MNAFIVPKLLLNYETDEIIISPYAVRLIDMESVYLCVVARSNFRDS